MGRRLLRVGFAVAVVAISPLLVATGVASASRVHSAGCSPIAGVPTTTSEVVDVTSPSARSVRGSVTLLRRAGSCFTTVAGPFGAWLGANGVSGHHVEGDLTTPSGIYAFESTMYGALPDPGLAYAYHRLTCGDWWDEASTSPQYNEFVHVTCGSTPGFASASEALWQELPAYNTFAVVAYNVDPRVPGRGSGIFLHQSTGGPTAGCVSLERPELLVVLRFLQPADQPRIDIHVT